MSYDQSNRRGPARPGSTSLDAPTSTAGKRTLTAEAPALAAPQHGGKGAAPRPPKTGAAAAAPAPAGPAAAPAGPAAAGKDEESAQQAGPDAAAAGKAPSKTGGKDGGSTHEESPAAGPAPTLSMSLQRMRASDIPTTPQAGLSYTTVSGPTKTDPGGFNWVVQWKLSGASPAGGWIVQHVKVTADITDKGGKVIAAGEDKDFGYWEAWQVNKGKAITTYAEGGDTADDTYAYPKSGDDTKGTIKVMGTAEFYEGLKLPSSFAADPSAPSGILPITRSKPTLAGGTGSISHNLTATWDATGGNKTTTITT